MVRTLSEFEHAYIEAALWSSMDNANEQGGEPLDANYTADDLAPESLDKMLADCRQFLTSGDIESLVSDDPRAAGHDFWLTRNGHGAGFWDGDWPEPAATLLTDAAHAMGQCDLYVGDDGKLYI